MPYRVHHPVHGYFAGPDALHPSWTRKSSDATVFDSPSFGAVCARFPGCSVENTVIVPDWRSIAVPFESLESELVGLPCVGFGEPESAGSAGGTGPVGVRGCDG